ncbi:hypothetical protein RRF57_001961 [Xylaria bambusicola]|uniref:Uncharacterized protein n=1 Tax=Xylaria bambusicola TaxID=326684 RepID=A0AAN7UJJ2_9PEZI
MIGSVKESRGVVRSKKTGSDSIPWQFIVQELWLVAMRAKKSASAQIEKSIVASRLDRIPQSRKWARPPTPGQPLASSHGLIANACLSVWVQSWGLAGV